MKSVILCIRNYVEMCSACSRCRNGSCAALKLFRQGILLSLFSAYDTHEDRAACIHQEIDDSGCDQISFADLIDQVENNLREEPFPESPAALSATLQEIKTLASWVSRMSKNRRLLLSDTVGAAIEHCLAFLDYSFLERDLDIEPLLREAFPDYNRTRVLPTCYYPMSTVSRYLRRALLISSINQFPVSMSGMRETGSNGFAEKRLSVICDAFFDKDSSFRRGNAFLPDEEIRIGEPIPDFPRCGEREIDSLAIYHDALPDINRYIEEPLADSFQMKCERAVLYSRIRVRDAWFARVIKALDVLSECGQERKNRFLLDLVFVFFDILEHVLNQAAGVGYVWGLCMRQGTTVTALDYYSELEKEQDVIRKGEKEPDKKKRRTISEQKRQSLQPFLDALIEAKYIRKDYTWIRRKTDKDNGHELYCAAWAAHIFRETLKIPQAWTGDLFGIKDISTYLLEAEIKEDLKKEIEDFFINKGLIIKTDSGHFYIKP